MTKLPAYRYRIEVVRVIDGDTLVADIDLGFHARIRTSLRLKGVNCPELNTPAGREARAFVVGLIEHLTLTAETHKADKYGGRWDATVYLPDGTSLADSLLTSGHAVAVSW